MAKSLFAIEGKGPQFADEASCFIAPNAAIIGDVIIGRHVSVWFSATIRGDNETMTIGDDTNIQDGAVLHSDLGYPLSVGNGATIGHRAVVHGCHIGDNCLIGIGTIVMNGAVIGDNCLVGAGAIVTEGKQFPAGSLILGAPARLLRALTEDEISKLKGSAQHYVQNGQRFQGLEAVSDINEIHID